MAHSFVLTAFESEDEAGVGAARMDAVRGNQVAVEKSIFALFARGGSVRAFRGSCTEESSLWRVNYVRFGSSPPWTSSWHTWKSITLRGTGSCAAVANKNV